MLTSILKRPYFIARHQELPLREEREAFLKHLGDQGTSHAALRSICWQMLNVMDQLQLKRMRSVSIDEIKEAAERWNTQQRSNPRARSYEGSARYFTYVAKKWLRFAGKLKQPTVARMRYADRVEDFALWMREEEGLSAHSVQSYCWKARWFLQWLSAQSRSLRRMQVKDVDEFLIFKAGHGWSRRSVAVAAQALRVFFRHAERRGWCRPGMRPIDASSGMSTEAPMRDKQTLGPWIRRFLMEHLPGERNLARNTQRSYRDAIRLLVLYASTSLHRKVDDLLISDIHAELLRKFLRYIEEKRKCSIASRNQRLAAVHGLAAFIAERRPEYMEWCAQIRAVKSKRSAPVPISYLEKREIDALLAVPNRATKIGSRDHALLLFLYNSGARADEAAHVRIEDLNLHAGASSALSSVRLNGKGGKVRTCPLWSSTSAELKKLISGRADKEPVFLNRNEKPLTRFGVHDVVTRCARVAMLQVPEMRQKRVGPHVIRHTTATHLLRAGVDINTIRAWLGHVSINTTNIYAETDLDMKAKALGMCEMKPPRTRKAWRDNPDLMSFLAQL